ncbi:hypothetical protein DFH11DRAFT_1630846 [Phellopilus nigrolimitatus]|nr:hypothetical protein DFH11DRAFT_1630846 [Phellopilus nigrolimitatus]
MSAAASLPPPPPPGLNYTAAIKPSLTFILVMTPLGSMIVPIIILLFFFSSPVSRSLPIFYLNIFACLIGLLEAFLNGALEVKQILYPTETIPQALFLATIASVVLSPVIIDSILLIRVLAFYPARTSPLRDRIKVLVFPVLVKCGRFIVVVLYLHSFTVESKNVGSVLLVGTVSWFRNPYILTEWVLQMVDNSYSSLFFLYKLRLFDKFGRAGWVDRHPTVLTRIRGLFYIALGNFVFPVILNIAQIVLISSDRSFLDGTYVLVVNNFVTIIGVVFATIWTSGQSWNRSTFGSTGSTWNQQESDKLSTLQHSGASRQARIRLPNARPIASSPRISSKPRANAGGYDDGSSIEMNETRLGDYDGSRNSLNKGERSLIMEGRSPV